MQRLPIAGIGFDRTHSVLQVDPAWKEATVAIHAKGPGVDLRVERVESITGVTGASAPTSIYNTVQMIGSTGPGEFICDETICQYPVANTPLRHTRNHGLGLGR